MPGVTDAPPLAGVIGWPIGQSKSPRLHGHWLRRHGVAGFYVPMAVTPEDLGTVLHALPKLGFRGVNVTVPHKERALALATEASTLATEIGAANMLTFGPGAAIHADNTDGYGFLANLRDVAPAWSAAAGPALVLGAGGGARAIVAALRADGASEVRLANRTRARAEALRVHFGPGVAVVDWADAAKAAEGAATIVNATSLGMAGQPPLDIALDAAPAHALVADIVYRPLVTPLLAAARARGMTAVDGLGMLLHQGVPAFECWFGVRPSVDDELRAVMLAE